MRTRLALFTILWHTREYRAFILMMVFLSLATSSTLPLVTLYLVDSLHIGLSLVGVFFVIQAVVGLTLGLLVGRWSDHWHSRLPAMRFAVIWVAIGWLAFALFPYFWVTVAVGALFLSAGAITMGQAFAALHDVMMRDNEAQPGFVNTTVRAAFSFGFVLGPLIGSQLAALVSFRAAFVVAASLNLLCLLPLNGLDIPVSADLDREPSVQGQRQSNIRLYVFVGLCTLVLIGTALRFTYLPIDVTKHLGGDIQQYGIVMAVSPLAELLTLPAIGMLALHYRIGRLFSLGLAVAIIEYLILAFNTAIWQVYVTQAIDALVVAVVFGLGLTYAQELSPGRAGLASSTFGSAFGIAILVGNLIGGISVSILGVPLIFLIPVVTSGVALMMFLALDHSLSEN
jgi:SET family sugar efflux transporter-like MFS transporter